ncbi:MAG: hypothetical protein ACXVXE_04960 [Nocardioidaceae bacterium]
MVRTCLVCLAVGAVLALGGCTSGSGPDPAAAPSRTAGARPSPTLGSSAAWRTPPTRPMDDLEKPIARQLAGQVRDEGLDLDYLDCPTWHHRVPSRLRCTGYFNGVTAKVLVRLHAMTTGAVRFDAVLQHGVVATRNLVARLRRDGYTHVDCGRAPAYPATRGRRIVCAGRERGARRYVVATVTDRAGSVTIRSYRGAS